MVFVCYPKCSTCKKAQKWLTDHGISFTVRDIVTDNPQAVELQEWHQASGLPIRRFFNTSGMLYREQNIKEKLDAGMSDEEAYELLSTNGMLVKRPIIVGKGVVLTGFREADWERALL
ncbi:MAG: arsenate reductase family protein [Raoultibacter sp.]